MARSIAYVSNDPVLSRVLPKLLQSRGYEVRVFRTIDELASAVLDEGSVALFDSRIGWENPEEVWAALESVPVILLHHGQASGPSATPTSRPVLAAVDAKDSTFEVILAEILKWLREATSAELAPSSSTAAAAHSSTHAQGSTTRGTTARGSATPETTTQVTEAQVTEAIPGRVAVGRVVSSAKPLKWHELYRDQGQLARELQAAPDMASAGSDKAAPRFERRLSKNEATARIAAFSQARPLKSTVSLALRIARDSSATVDDMARVVKQDQALAARVLQLANCSLHRRGSAVRTVEQAIVRMGAAALRETISSSNVLDQFEDSSGMLNVSLLWEHGYAVGMLAADLARATRVTSVDDAFMIGLLHDMGRAVMAFELGEDYIEALLQARQHDLKPAEVEKQFFEINHADVADTVFASWEFDEAITAPVANHHLSDRNLKHLAPAHVRQTKLLQAADTLAHAALIGDSGSDWIDAAALDLGGSSLSPGLLRTCLQRAEKTLEEIRLLNASAHEPVMEGGCAAHMRAQLPENATLGWAEDAGELDLMGVLAWSLGGQTTPKPPADALLATVRTSADLDRVAAATKAHEASGRPVPLVLSVHGDPLRKETEARFSDRPTHLVPQSFRVSWVLAGLKRLLEDS